MEAVTPTRYPLPAAFVDSQGRTVLSIGEDGTFRLNDPATGLPRMEFGSFDVPDGMREPQSNLETHVGLWVFDRQGRRVGGLASLEFPLHPVDDPELGAGYGSVVLFSRSEIPGVELRADHQGEGELLLRAPLEDHPGNYGVTLRGFKGEGRFDLYRSIRMQEQDGTFREFSFPFSFGASDF